MLPLNHWHPILRARALRGQPVGVRLCGKNLVLFRAGDGSIGALEDCCPHRRMRLSKGNVVSGRLQCAYHGWTFNSCGAGESPGTPKLHANAVSFEAVERHGAILVKPAGADAVFPPFDVAGYYHACTLQHFAKAPLELVLDNFTEIEHTPTTHAMFGYPLDRMKEVEVRFEPTPTSVRVINIGPTKQFGLWLRLLLGVGKDYQFNDDWVTYFSPVYSIYDHWWTHPQTGREGMVRWRLYIFFIPIDEQETSVLTFAYTKSRYPGPYGAVRLFKRKIRRMLDHEIQLDVRILENLADKNPSLDGMKLSRFDRVLSLNRERIEKIYRGHQQAE
jgi:phenylpropionate dioxygenase-like ring-hydroxylating dioxygenase large terminal subunit